MMESLRTASAKEAKVIIDCGLSTVEAFQATLNASTPFPHLPDAEVAFLQDLQKEDSNKSSTNVTVDSLYQITRAALHKATTHIQSLRRFISLHLPQMEDGNNFGVSIQMNVSKALDETSDKWEKMLADSSKYYSSRMELIDKVNQLAVPKTTTTETKTVSKSTSSGKKEEELQEHESKESESSVTEEKSIWEDGLGKSNALLHRQKALAALDAQMYFELMLGFQKMVDGYAMIVDTVEKNWEKLENPRGKGYGGYGSGGSSMVY